MYLPELDRYLLDYPKANVENTQSQFYWEKVSFGLKPTLRMVQAIVYRAPNPAEPAYAVAIKQLYSSHYFETALDLTVCVKDQGTPRRDGFYLITLKGSQQAGLTGLTGGIVRKVAVDKTRSSMERVLVYQGATRKQGEVRLTGREHFVYVIPDRRTAEKFLTILFVLVLLTIVYAARRGSSSSSSPYYSHT